MNEIIYIFSALPIFIAIFYALFHVITKHERRHHIRHILIISITSVLSFLVAVILKNIIAHPRPDLTQAIFMPNDIYSFPSGHATFMFGLAFAMHSFDKHAGKILFVLALITGIARVLAGVHYWYDIVGGFFVGAIVSYIVLLLTKRIRS